MNLLDPPEISINRLIKRKITPTVTVVVCTRDRVEMLQRCLGAVRKLRHPGFAVVVVDNAPSSDSARAAAALHGAQYVVEPVRGVSRARNAGARHCATDILAYLDDDMVPHPDWLSALVAEFGDPEVVAVSGPVLPMENEGGDAQRLREEVRSRPWGPEPFHLHRLSPKWFERANFGGVGDGNMAFRRDAFDRWSGFEVRIGRGAPVNGGEEHYAFFELIERGGTVAYTPRALVFHADKAPTDALSLRNIAESSAYATFLCVRHPRYAARILRFYVEALAGKRRAWRSGNSQPVLANVSRSMALGAFIRGVWTCLGSLLASRASPGVAKTSPPARRVTAEREQARGA